MLVRTLRSTLPILALACVWQPASSRADVFDWNNVNYKPATTSTGAPLTVLSNSALTTNTLSIQIGLNNGATFLTTPASPVAGSNATNPTPPTGSDNTFNANYAVGGQATTHKALQLGADFATNTQYMLVTIFFAKPVTSVTFSVFDVDTPTAAQTTQYADQVRAIQGVSSANGTTVTPVSLTNVSNTYTSVDSATQVTGKANSDQTANTANATATFSSSTPISQFSFVYGDGYTGTTAHATQQLIALGNISFTTVPEPGTLAMLGLGVFGAAGIAFRRRTQK